MTAVRRWIGRVGSAGVSGGVFALGLYRGLTVLTVQVDLAAITLAVVALEAALSGVLFTATTLLSGALFLAKDLRHDCPVKSVTGSVTAIVPVHRDGDVLHRSVESLRRADWPDLGVKIVVEPGDGASIERARNLASGDPDVAVMPNRRSRSKAAAINHAVAETDSRFIAVFDADERVDPEFLPCALARLDDHDVVQGRTVPEPEGWVEWVAYCESVLLSYVARRPVSLLTRFRMAASRAVVMRRSAFETVGGYDPDALTEDFAFGFDCYRAGLSVADCVAHPSRIAAAHGVRDWVGQRRRWLTGYAQVFHGFLHRPGRFLNGRHLVATGICAGTLAGSVLLIALPAKLVVLAAVGALPWVLPPVAAVYLVLGAVRFVDRRRGRIGSGGVPWLFAPLALPLYGLVAIRSVVGYCCGRGADWYHVEKVA